MSGIITFWDWLLAPFYLTGIYILASYIRGRHINYNPVYRYFLFGLFAKILGAVSLCLVYVYYYREGGDTLNYYGSAKSFLNLLFQSRTDFNVVFFHSATPENYHLFSESTGYPSYWNDGASLSVVKLLVPLELVSFKSYIVTSILMAAISFTGVWKLYLMFCEIYPDLSKQFALCVLFIPSVLFWGSGILKDSWTIAATGWFVFSFYKIIIQHNRVWFNFLAIIISSAVLIIIKPYIFVALMPGCLLWGAWDKIVSIRNLILRFLFLPFIVVIGFAGGLGVWSLFGSQFGEFSSIDSAINAAHVKYNDLKMDYYQGNSFDLGAYDPTIVGILSKFPIAVMTGLFRPFIWEAKNVVMITSGIENLIVLFFVLYVFIRNPVSSFGNLISKPIVLFCLVFAVFFSFSVAISTSNFGALVRLRIPQMPFLLCGLVIVNRKRTAIEYEHTTPYKLARQ